MNTRRRLVLALGAGALEAPLASFAQRQPAKVYRIGYLAGGSLAILAPRIEGLRQGLLKLGYVEGQNIAIEYRGAEGKVDRLPGLAAELVRLKVEVIITAGPVPTTAARRATNTIPIVMTNDPDPVAEGFIASLARPGGNITGLASISAELSGKRLEMLKETVPGLSRVVVFGNTTDAGNARALKEMEGAARALGLILQYLAVESFDDLERAFKAAIKGRSQALVTFQNPVLITHRTLIVEFAEKNRLPAMYANRETVEAGGLMTYGPDETDLYRRAATFVDKILKGTKPADLPVEQPTKFELIINLKTAKTLGLTIPKELLLRADKVIE